MASRRMCCVCFRWLRQVILIALPVTLLVAGCARVNPLNSHAVVQLNKTPPTVGLAIEPGNDHADVAGIVKKQIQPGHYTEAAIGLRRYLKQHPGDRAAQSLLRQLTADPQEMLGRQRRIYLVQPGDSYSGLAARYLGDADMFLILARYNGSTHPSVLLVGEKVYLPLSVPRDDNADRGAIAATRGGSEPAGPGQAGATPPIPPGNATTGASSATKASQLQDESVALLKQGHQREALARLDQALTLDPQLKSNGSASASMRSQLVAQYHQRAIVLYRDQQLDQAITLWDRVLTIHPGFEPAIIYRARALELKHRLLQL
jgi:tetratricopeptide (TPR) repeat protein